MKSPLNKLYKTIKREAEKVPPWRFAVHEEGNSLLYSALNLLVKSVKKFKAFNPEIDEENLYSHGLEYIAEKIEKGISGVTRYSEAHFYCGLNRYLAQYITKHTLPVNLQSLEQALEEGDYVEELGFVPERLDFRENLERVFLHLKKRYLARKVETLELRFGLKDGLEHTLTEISKIFKRSREMIRQYESEIIRKILEHPPYRRLLEPYTDVKFSQPPLSEWTALRRIAGISKADKSEVPAVKEQRATEKLHETLTQLEEKLGQEKAKLVYELFAGNPIGFIDFVKTRYGLSPDSSELRRVTHLSKEERQGLEKSLVDMAHKEVKIVDPYLDKILEQFFPRELKEFQEAIVPRLIDNCMPAYVRDPKKTVEILKAFAQKRKGSSLVERVVGYFSNISKLETRGLKTELMPYQKADIAFMDENPHVLYANDMGLGKSLAILVAFWRSAADKMLVLCPASAASGVWPEQITQHFENPPRFRVIQKWGAAKEVKKLYKENEILIVSYGSLQQAAEDLKQCKFDFIVIDESHMITNQQTRRYKNIAELHAPRKVQSSGTPFKNTRRELWAPLRWLAPERFDLSQKEYNDKYMSEEGVCFLAYDLKNVMIRRRKSEMLPDLPPVESIDELVSLNAGEQKRYKKIESNFLKWWKEEVQSSRYVTRLLKGIVISKLHELRKYAIQPKLRKLPHIVDDIKRRREKVVISTTYRAPARDICEMFDPKEVCYIDGSVNGEERAREISEFQKNPEKKEMIITEAGSQSITLTAANNLIVVNDPWTWASKQQQIDRLHRIGQTKPVRVWNLQTRETIDERISSLLEFKKKEFTEVFDTTLGYLDYRSDEISNIQRIIEQLAS